MSYDIAMQLDVPASPDAVYAALTTTDGIAGWWTTRNETTGTPGGVDRFWFPGMPEPWQLRVDAAEPGKLLAWHCVAGPPGWIGTEVRWSLEPAADGTRVVFDHTGFAAKDEMLRTVTLGWAQMLLRLTEFARTGTPTPFFDHD
jgi:uncharacterized protein YndB with AHSA1/START domain